MNDRSENGWEEENRGKAAEDGGPPKRGPHEALMEDAWRHGHGIGTGERIEGMSVRRASTRLAARPNRVE